MAVYFIKAVPSGNIKIGYSLNPQSRMAQLQTGSFERLELLGWIHGDMALEQEIHAIPHERDRVVLELRRGQRGNCGTNDKDAPAAHLLCWEGPAWIKRLPNKVIQSPGIRPGLGSNGRQLQKI
jgi:hypothetical protein